MCQINRLEARKMLIETYNETQSIKATARTKVMGSVFTNEKSCNQIIYGVTQYLNENWAEKNRNAQNEFIQNA
ncbi:MAG: hypothetical protein ACP5QD_02975 [Candidatus Ratteibacteria bacterium]